MFSMFKEEKKSKFNKNVFIFIAYSVFMRFLIFFLLGLPFIVFKMNGYLICKIKAG
jgi:hypothetical protein